jgi:hypothetical protein
MNWPVILLLSCSARPPSSASRLSADATRAVIRCEVDDTQRGFDGEGAFAKRRRGQALAHDSAAHPVRPAAGIGDVPEAVSRPKVYRVTHVEGELRLIFGDGVSQAADLISVATSIPSLNVTP